MSIYRRGGVYWHSFVFLGERIQESTRQSDRKKALQMEAARKTRCAEELKEREAKARAMGCQPGDLIFCVGCEKLLNGAVAVISNAGRFCGRSCYARWERDHVAVPALKEYENRFANSVKTRCAEKPLTIEFYMSKFARLLEFTPLADARLDLIDEALIESFVQHRRKAVRPASVNRELATLRKALRLALKWSVTVSQKYVHPSPEAIERAFERLEAMNAHEAKKVAEAEKNQLVSTVLTTPEPLEIDAAVEVA